MLRAVRREMTKCSDRADWKTTSFEIKNIDVIMDIEISGDPRSL